MAILAFLNGIFLRIVGLLLSLIMVWTVPPSRAVTFEAKDPDNLRLQVSVFADIHMQGFFWSQFRLPMQSFDQLTRSLRDISGAAQPIDALVLLGDNTMNGQSLEYIWLYGLLSRYNRARETFVVMGNHDLSLNTMAPRTAIDRHNFFWQSYDGTRATEAYYSRVIGGYTFIALAGEGPADGNVTNPSADERIISDEQIAWLAQTMENAPEGKPIFVFVHQHVNTGFPLPEFFPRAAEIREILEQYDNVFVFNGHWHSLPMLYSLENGVHYVNAPTIHSHGYGEHDIAGEGLQLEVYDDRVIIRGRNFMAGEWMDEYFVVELVQ